MKKTWSAAGDAALSARGRRIAAAACEATPPTKKGPGDAGALISSR
jgi:hypothetical protein